MWLLLCYTSGKSGFRLVTSFGGNCSGGVNAAVWVSTQKEANLRANHPFHTLRAYSKSIYLFMIINKIIMTISKIKFGGKWLKNDYFSEGYCSRMRPFDGQLYKVGSIEDDDASDNLKCLSVSFCNVLFTGLYLLDFFSFDWEHLVAVYIISNIKSTNFLYSPLLHSFDSFILYFS